MATIGTVPSAGRFEPDLMRRKLNGTLFLGGCIAAIGILMIALLLVLYDVLVQGLPWLDADFITGVPSRRPENAGILPALVGSVQLALIVGVVTFPIGVAAAIYLTEYAPEGLLNGRSGRTSRTSPASHRSSTASSGWPFVRSPRPHCAVRCADAVAADHAGRSLCR
jgi:hypothetical protein